MNSESARYANGISKSQRTVTFVSLLPIYPFLDTYPFLLFLFLSVSFFLLFFFFTFSALVRPSVNLVTRRRIDTRRGFGYTGSKTEAAFPSLPSVYL